MHLDMLSNLKNHWRTHVQNPTWAGLHDKTTYVDAGGNGASSFRAFCFLMARKVKDNGTKEESINAFEAFDRDGNWVIRVA